MRIHICIASERQTGVNTIDTSFENCMRIDILGKGGASHSVASVGALARLRRAQTTASPRATAHPMHTGARSLLQARALRRIGHRRDGRIRSRDSPWRKRRRQHDGTDPCKQTCAEPQSASACAVTIRCEGECGAGAGNVHVLAFAMDEDHETDRSRLPLVRPLAHAESATARDWHHSCGARCTDLWIDVFIRFRYS